MRNGLDETSGRPHNTVQDETVRETLGGGGQVGKAVLDQGPAPRLQQHRVTVPERGVEQCPEPVELGLHRHHARVVVAGEGFAFLRERALPGQAPESGK